MSEPMSGLTWAAMSYPLRRLTWIIRSQEPACRDRWCAKPTVGLTVWCRRHADAILTSRKLRSHVFTVPSMRTRAAALAEGEEQR